MSLQTAYLTQLLKIHTRITYISYMYMYVWEKV